MKKLNLFFVLFLSSAIFLMAQSDETKEKLKNLKGDVTKITIETDNDEIEISGDDAKTLFKRLNSKHHFMPEITEIGKDKKMIFIEKGDSDKEFNIDVDVEIDDCEDGKVIIIKKNVDGKETIEKFEGEKADEFMKQHSKGEKMKFLSDDGEITIITEMDSDEMDWDSKDDSLGISKNIEVKIENDVKTVTVTTTENGKEKVEVYKGEKADEFLGKQNDDKMDLNSSEDGNKKIIKKKVTIKKEKEEKE